MSKARSSAAIALYQLLDALEARGATLPKGTTHHIRVDTDFCLHLDDTTGLGAGDLYRAFFRRPVRQCRAIIVWSQREAPNDLEEQTRMIACWSQRNSWRKQARRLKAVA